MESKYDKHKDEIIESYSRLGNVWKVGSELGFPGQEVHRQLTRWGKINKMNLFSDDDKQLLICEYEFYCALNHLDLLAEKLGRTKPFINRKAKELGLTGKVKNKMNNKKKVSKFIKEWQKKNGHPRGMKGKKHTDETKAIFSKRTTERWKDPNSVFNSDANKQKLSDRMSLLQASGKLNNNYSRTKSGIINIGGKTMFIRSGWEGNICCYFEFLKNKKLISEWEYEPKTFWFEKIKRGVRSYKPDFRITNIDGTQYYVEVKGWMDSKSKTKLARFKKYYPNETLELIDSKRYKEIGKQSAFIPLWGILDTQNDSNLIIKCSVPGCDNKNHSKTLCRKHYFKVYKK